MAETIEAADGNRDRSTIVKQLGLVLVLLFLTVVAQGWQIVRAYSVKSQAWEYLIEGPADDQRRERLQVLGTAGWELVSARRATTERGGKTEEIYEMIFRRPGEALAAPTPPLAPATPR
jgi:hypothetical protein